MSAKKKNDINTEQLLLEAAEKVFLEKGYAQAKTTEIAHLAGVNHAMLHYYFHTKEHIFEKIFQKKVGEINEALMPTLDDNLSFFEKMENVIGIHFDFLKKNPLLPRFIINEMLNNKERLAKYRETPAKNIYNAIKAGVEENVKDGTIRKIEPLQLLMDIVSLNLSAFLALSTLRVGFGMSEEDIQAFLEARKEEVIQTIISRLKPTEDEKIEHKQELNKKQ